MKKNKERALFFFFFVSLQIFFLSETQKRKKKKSYKKKNPSLDLFSPLLSLDFDRWDCGKLSSIGFAGSLLDPDVDCFWFPSIRVWYHYLSPFLLMVSCFWNLRFNFDLELLWLICVGKWCRLGVFLGLDLWNSHVMGKVGIFIWFFPITVWKGVFGCTPILAGGITRGNRVLHSCGEPFFRFCAGESDIVNIWSVLSTSFMGTFEFILSLLLCWWSMDYIVE